MPTTTATGVRISWQETGSGSPVLLVMGASYSSALWYSTVEALRPHHRVLTFDNRGTGDSDWTKVASIQDMAADARAVMDAAGVESAHVYGVSLGGIVVQQLALESPERVRSLVLGCTGMLTADKRRAPSWLKLLLWLPKSWRAKLLGRGGYGPACPPDRAARDREVLALDHNVRAAMAAQQDALRVYSVTPEQVATLSMPTLVLHGTADPVVKHAWGQELATTLGTRLISYEGAGHNYIVAAGDVANDDVRAFFSEVDALQPAP